MKIAFVGKGGSGKSTASWLFTRYLSSKGHNVLAIDADYNMDLAYSLGWKQQRLNFLNHAEKDFYTYQQLNNKILYTELPTKKNLKSFTFLPKDTFTQKYSKQLSQEENIHLMIAGSTHEETLYGHRCSHAYLAPLKYYLALLDKPEDSFVVIDSVAGTDMVSYGLYLGVDALITVVEPTQQSLNVFNQIKKIAQEFNIPLFVIMNKTKNNEQNKKILAEIQEHLLGSLPQDPAIMEANFEDLKPETLEQLEYIYKQLHTISFDNQAPWERFITWRSKYELQLETQGVSQ